MDRHGNDHLSHMSVSGHLEKTNRGCSDRLYDGLSLWSRSVIELQNCECYNHPLLLKRILDINLNVSNRNTYQTTNAKTPFAAEKQLVEHLPEEVIPIAHHWLILHGRYICVARKPKCDKCEITHFCKYYKELEIRG